VKLPFGREERDGERSQGGGVVPSRTHLEARR